jgi:hypothetical protein
LTQIYSGFSAKLVFPPLDEVCEYGFAIFVYAVLLFELPDVFAQVAPVVVFHSTVSLFATHVTIFALISPGTAVRFDGK